MICVWPDSQVAKKCPHANLHLCKLLWTQAFSSDLYLSVHFSELSYWADSTKPGINLRGFTHQFKENVMQTWSLDPQSQEEFLYCPWEVREFTQFSNFCK